MKQIKILLLVGTIALFTACGGGSSGDSANNPSDIGENPTEILTLNEAFKSYTPSVISIQDQMYDAIGLLSNNYTKVIDANDMTMDEANAFYDKLKLMEPEIIKAVLLEYQMSVLSHAVTQEESTNIAINYKSDIPDTGIVITGGAIVVGALVIYVGKTLYDHGIESKKKLYDSADNLINGAEENSKLQNHLKGILGLAESATRDEMLATFNGLEDKKETVSRNMLDDANTYYPLDAEDALLYHKKNVVKVAGEGLIAATKATAAGTAAGAGSLITSAAGASNVKSALPYVPIADTSAKVTLTLTAAETTSAGLGAALGTAAVLVKSGEKEEEQIPKPEILMTKEQALEKLREVKDGLIEGLGIEEIVDATRTVLQEMAKNNGDTVNEDGTVTIKIPKVSQIIIVEEEHVDKDIEIQKMENPDIAIISENTEPVMVSNVDLSDGYIEIRIPLEEGTVVEPNTDEWVLVDTRWWAQDPGLEIEENIFIDYISNVVMLGESSYRVHYYDSNPFSAPLVDDGLFGTEQNWTVPPQVLIPGKEYPMDTTLKRTVGTNVFYMERGIIISMDDYQDDDYSCMTSGAFEKLITTKKVYVTSNPSDLSENSWEGEFRAPNAGEYNDKFQIEVYYAGGCTRYIYERKE